MAVAERPPFMSPDSFNHLGIDGERANLAFHILDKYRTSIPWEVWNQSSAMVGRVFEEFKYSEGLNDTATSAFFIHTRRHRNGEINEEFMQLDDSTRFLPILDPKYLMEEADVEQLWNSLPPFKVGEVRGKNNGKDVRCVLVSIPITPKGLSDCERASERANYARPRISEGVGFAQRMGAKVIGLGETLASLTRHGEILQEQFPDLKITTGHAFTTYFMNEWTKFAAKEMGTDISRSSITIIGANGAIGSAITDVLLKEGVGALKLHDKENMVSILEKKALEIQKQYPRMEGKIIVTGGDGKLKEACHDSKIILIATSAPKPFLKAQHLDSGTYIINDSQPPAITREEAQKAKSKTLWVVGGMPPGAFNTFNSGLISAEWTCLLEVLALESLASEMSETVGPVTPERVEKAGEVARKLGMNLPLPQSWGVLENTLLEDRN